MLPRQFQNFKCKVHNRIYSYVTLKANPRDEKKKKIRIYIVSKSKKKQKEKF